MYYGRKAVIITWSFFHQAKHNEVVFEVRFGSFCAGYDQREWRWVVCFWCWLQLIIKSKSLLNLSFHMWNRGPQFYNITVFLAFITLLQYTVYTRAYFSLMVNINKTDPEYCMNSIQFPELNTCMFFSFLNTINYSLNNKTIFFFNNKKW